MYIYIYTIYVCIYIYTIFNIFIYSGIYRYTNIYIYICTHHILLMFVYIHIYIFTGLHTNKYLYIYIYITLYLYVISQHHPFFQASSASSFTPLSCARCAAARHCSRARRRSRCVLERCATKPKQDTKVVST